jgi:hypothetical protein
MYLGRYRLEIIIQGTYGTLPTQDTLQEILTELEKLTQLQTDGLTWSVNYKPMPPEV